jgi:hypothetical protein
MDPASALPDRETLMALRFVLVFVFVFVFVKS